MVTASTKAAREPAQSDYWGFYWPLALTGIVSLLAQQLQNAALARYPDAAYELATFALAAGAFHLFDAVLIFLPQMVNVLARSRAAARLCLIFTLAVCGAMTVPVVLLALPPVGGPLLGAIFHIQGEQLRQVLLYMALLAPNIVMVGLRHYYTGLIVQEKKTGIITVLNAGFLVVIGVMLVAGRLAGWGAVVTLALAQLVASVGQLAILWRVAGRVCNPDRFGSSERLTVRKISDFFWPVALTSLMFSLSRPILYSFLGRLPDPAPVIAAMRVGFDFGLIFHNLLNQFRHLFVTFGKTDLAGVRRFMARVTFGVVAVMLVVVLSPLSHVVLRDWIGVEGRVLVMSRQVLMVMCLLPVLVAVRNYFHGLAMIDRKTGPMGAGAVVRNLATYGASALFLALGWLNHVTAAAIMVTGFLGETLVVIFWHPVMRRTKAALAFIPWPVAGEDDEE
jgi:hypothetical protein